MTCAAGVEVRVVQRARGGEAKAKVRRRHAVFANLKKVWRVEATGHRAGLPQQKRSRRHLLLRGPDLEEVWLWWPRRAGRRKDTRARRRNVRRRLGH